MAENTQPQMVNVVDPDTQQIGSIPAHQLEEAQSQGYEAASPEAVEQYFKEQKYGTPGQKLKTAAEGAASAATLGLSTGLETQLGVKPEDIQARREINPYSHMAGQVAGIAGTSFLPGLGEAGAATEAGVKAINPLSAQSVMSGLGERAAQSLGLEGLGGAATKGAVENAIFQGGDEISRMFSHDPNQSIQTAAADVGLASLIGGGIGGTLGAGEQLWNAKFGGKTGQFIEDFRGRIKEHLENPDPVNILQQELQGRLSSSDEVFDEVYGPKGLKAEAIQKLMPEKLSNEMVGSAQDVLNKAKSFSIEMERNPDLYPGHLRAGYNRDLNIFSDELSKPANPEQVFNGLQSFKQRLQAYLPKKGQFLTTVAPEYEFINKMRGLSGELRTELENPEIWGKAADVQQEINKAFSQYLTPRKQFEGKFTSKVGDEKVIDPGKLQTYLNQTGKAGQKIKQEMLGNFLEADSAYRKAIDSAHTRLGLESPFPQSSLHYTKSTLEELTPGARFADAFVKKGLLRLAGEAAGTTVGASVGHLFGAGWVGALIGEHALAPFFSSILPSLVKPMLENPNSAGGFKKAVELGLSVLRGESAINKASKAVFKAGKEVLPQTLVPSSSKRSKLEKTIQSYQQNPQQMMNIGTQAGHYLPDHASALGQTAANSVNYLGSLKPAQTKQNPLDSEPKLTEAQKLDYQNALNIAEQPLVVLQQIKNGTVTPQDVNHLKNLYPDLYGKLVTKLNGDLTDHLSKGHEIPYRTRLGLSLFMAQNLDSTLTPQSLQLIQSSFMMNHSSQQQPQMRAKHSMNALQKLPGMNETAGQSREARRLK